MRKKKWMKAVERGICFVVQGVAGLVMGLCNVAVEFLMLPFTHVLRVHHPDSLKMEINRGCYV